MYKGIRAGIKGMVRFHTRHILTRHLFDDFARNQHTACLAANAAHAGHTAVYEKIIFRGKVLLQKGEHLRVAAHRIASELVTRLYRKLAFNLACKTNCFQQSSVWLAAAAAPSSRRISPRISSRIAGMPRPVLYFRS